MSSLFFFVSYLRAILNAKGDNDALKEHRITFESRADILSTLGVLGTFFGITWGLMGFNADNLDKSIPILLGGLKTAFFTSLAGMICSLVYNSILNHIYDVFEVSQPSTQEDSVAKICEAITQMTDVYTNSIETIKTQLALHNNNQATFFTTINSQLKLLELIPDISGEVKSISCNVSAISETEREHLTEAKSYSEILHREVADIESKMRETNELLTMKFNEFSVLLKKSNTEALVEVMRGLTEEFQKQMGSLIEKLVKENFEQLNDSVKQLNMWQMENKAMIQSLTSQYKEMSENFANDAEALNKLTKNTSLLVSDGGKLQELLSALSKVMIDDTRFVEITKNLEDSAQLSKDNMSKFDESTEKLNDWVRKQRNFVDAVMQLMSKLEEINKINDYSAQFWKETKKGMDDSIGIIKSTSKSLNDNLRSINQEFYERLASTLSELDVCIQAMIKQKNGN